MAMTILGGRAAEVDAAGGAADNAPSCGVEAGSAFIDEGEAEGEELEESVGDSTTVASDCDRVGPVRT